MTIEQKLAEIMLPGQVEKAMEIIKQDRTETFLEVEGYAPLGWLPRPPKPYAKFIGTERANGALDQMKGVE